MEVPCNGLVLARLVQSVKSPFALTRQYYETASLPGLGLPRWRHEADRVAARSGIFAGFVALITEIGRAVRKECTGIVLPRLGISTTRWTRLCVTQVANMATSPARTVSPIQSVNRARDICETDCSGCPARTRNSASETGPPARLGDGSEIRPGRGQWDRPEAGNNGEKTGRRRKEPDHELLKRGEENNHPKDRQTAGIPPFLAAYDRLEGKTEDDCSGKRMIGMNRR